MLWSSGEMSERDTSSGLVIRAKGADFYVSTGTEEARCSLRGRFRLERADEDVIPVVGDTVRFRREQGGDPAAPRGVIVEIEPRKSVLVRSEAFQKKGYRILGANMDQVILVFAVKQPALNLRLLDRMLVAALCGSMEAVICINKMDLVSAPDHIEEDLAPYRAMGYQVVLSSAKTREGIDGLASLLASKLSILAGPSGSGKTSLVSCVQPGLELAIADVSARTGKGTHTTSHFELHPLAFGGFLGDTPGVREFGIWGVSREKLAGFFRDLAPYRGECRFATCTHSHEPGCAVKEAVESGTVARARYESYLRILDTLPDERTMKHPR